MHSLRREAGGPTRSVKARLDVPQTLLATADEVIK
jgi:hypothetical protein